MFRTLGGKMKNFQFHHYLSRQVYELIERVSGQKVIAMTVSGWTESVKDAIRRPLFALILASYLRQNTTQAPTF